MHPLGLPRRVAKKKKKKQKGLKMIKSLTCYETAAVENLTIENIKDRIKKHLLQTIYEYDGPILDTTEVFEKTNWLNRIFCNKKDVILNDKNLEYSEEYWMIDGWELDAGLQKTLGRYGIYDIRINLFIYRIGSYSYYMAICYATTGNEPRCEG